MIESISGAATIFAEFGGIFAALITGNEPDFFPLQSAMRGEGLWLWGFLMTIVGGLIMERIYHFVPWVERNLESTLMVVSYLMIGAIIFIEVIRRFVFSEQFPWSTTIPGYLFLIMCWTGCSYNVRLRTHLAFSEFRSKMGRTPQMGLLSLDAILWWGVCWLVIVTASQVTANAGNNFMIITGTDNVFVWWFLIALPLTFVLLAGRVFENLFEDFKNYRSGKPLIEATVLGGQ